MALDKVTIKITNTNSNPVVLGAIDTTVISPTGITTPDTPYTEYIADSVTLQDGSVKFPFYKRFQNTVLPAASITTIETENYDEAVYYAALDGKIKGVKVELTTNPIELITLTFDKTSIEIEEEATSAITPTTTPAGQTVTWASSDETVATVSSGTVTGEGAGTATITGTFTYEGVTVTATCDVTVTAKA